MLLLHVIILLGKQVQLDFSDRRSDVKCEDIKELVLHIHELHPPAGGPSVLERAEAQPPHAVKDMTGQWQHQQCTVFLKQEGSTSVSCQWLRMNKEAKRQKHRNYFHLTMAQRPSYAAASKKACYTLKRSVTRVTKNIETLASKLKGAQEQLSAISDESLEDKLSGLLIPEGAIANHRVHCSC